MSPVATELNRTSTKQFLWTPSRCQILTTNLDRHPDKVGLLDVRRCVTAAAAHRLGKVGVGGVDDEVLVKVHVVRVLENHAAQHRLHYHRLREEHSSSILVADVHWRVTKFASDVTPPLIRKTNKNKTYLPCCLKHATLTVWLKIQCAKRKVVLEKGAGPAKAFDLSASSTIVLAVEVCPSASERWARGSRPPMDFEILHIPINL